MTRWGVIALVCGAIAVLSANVGALVPESAFAGLHASRLGSASLSQLRAELAQLRTLADELQRNDLQLTQRLALSEQSSGDLVKRLAAVEVSIPDLLEAVPEGAVIDRAAVTASIEQAPLAFVEVPGGSATVQTKPMIQAGAAQQTIPQAFPEQQPSGDLGVAIGPAIAANAANSQWDELAYKAGPLLLGLKPLLSVGADDSQAHLVAGPLLAMSEATALCRRLEKLSIACLPMPYRGEALGQ